MAGRPAETGEGLCVAAGGGTAPACEIGGRSPGGEIGHRFLLSAARLRPRWDSARVFCWWCSAQRLWRLRVSRSGAPLGSRSDVVHDGGLGSADDAERVHPQVAFASGPPSARSV